MSISILIPVFNEEKTIQTVLKKVLAFTMPKLAVEILVIDDGSTDRTRENAEKIIKYAPNVRLISHKKNSGKGAAIISGMKHARNEYILIQDADLEYDPVFIPSLLTPILTKKAQVVFGTRLKRLPNLKYSETTPLFLLHYFGNRFLSLLTSILYGQWITDMETGYKVFPRTLFSKNPLTATSFAIEPEITARIMKAGLRIIEVPITTNPRGYSEGKKLHTFRDGSRALFTLLKNRVQ